MGKHTFPVENADALDDEARYRYCSREELLAMVDPWGGTVADLGSGTGFYTNDVAPYADTVYAIDLQPEMHDRYRENGVPENVELVTAEIADLPLDDDEVTAAFSTMTYHEFGGEEALEEIRRVMVPDARLVAVDWTAEGEGESGPPLNERYSLSEAVEHHRTAGFSVAVAESRVETFRIVATP